MKTFKNAVGGLIAICEHLLPCHSPDAPSSSMPEATYMLNA